MTEKRLSKKDAKETIDRMRRTVPSDDQQRWMAAIGVALDDVYAGLERLREEVKTLADAVNAEKELKEKRTELLAAAKDILSSLKQ